MPLTSSTPTLSRPTVGRSTSNRLRGHGRAHDGEIDIMLGVGADGRADVENDGAARAGSARSRRARGGRSGPWCAGRSSTWPSARRCCRPRPRNRRRRRAPPRSPSTSRNGDGSCAKPDSACPPCRRRHWCDAARSLPSAGDGRAARARSSRRRRTSKNDRRDYAQGTWRRPERRRRGRNPRPWRRARSAQAFPFPCQTPVPAALQFGSSMIFSKNRLSLSGFMFERAGQ